VKISIGYLAMAAVLILGAAALVIYERQGWGLGLAAVALVLGVAALGAQRREGVRDLEGKSFGLLLALRRKGLDREGLESWLERHRN